MRSSGTGPNSTALSGDQIIGPLITRLIPAAPTAGTSELGFNHVLDAVRRLPARQRNAITLRYELQLSDAEIAETLGMPLGTVKSTLHRALARLRTEVIE